MPLPVSSSAVIPIRACAIPLHYNMSDTSSSPQRKRLREESDCDALVEKDRGVWLEDGNVVVIARNIAFRVYKQALMDCSEVFRARLSTIDETTQ